MTLYRKDTMMAEHHNMENIRYLTDTNRYLIDKLQNTLFIDEIHIVYTN